jgi:hypothetical protein
MVPANSPKSLNLLGVIRLFHFTTIVKTTRKKRTKITSSKSLILLARPAGFPSTSSGQAHFLWQNYGKKVTQNEKRTQRMRLSP